MNTEIQKKTTSDTKRSKTLLEPLTLQEFRSSKESRKLQSRIQTTRNLIINEAQTATPSPMGMGEEGETTL